MKQKFYYVDCINLYVNVNLIQSFQLVERDVMDYNLGKLVRTVQCCISMGKNAYICDEKYYHELAKLLA